MEEGWITVSALTRYIQAKFDSDALLQDLWIQGEVSNFSIARSGHCYFTLKDSEATLRCVMWRSSAQAHTRLPSDGEAVLAHGYVSVYAPQGVYQFYTDQILPIGRGELYLSFEALKARLAAEGLFDQERKRPLPPFPHRIGIATSPVGAALQDVLNILRRRWPLVEVVLAPTQVQGEEAPAQIVAALSALAREDVDLILVVRGGGSLEDLWPFNTEEVARAIANSPVPVVSGVGHETDFTIADFAADVRAPTPSAAAEIAVPDRAEVREWIVQLRERAQRAFIHKIQNRRQAIEQRKRLLSRLSPAYRLALGRQRVDELVHALSVAARSQLVEARRRTERATGRLAVLDPYATLRRGYAIVYDGETGHVITSIDDVSVGKAIGVQVSDGKFGAEVTDVEYTEG